MEFSVRAGAPTVVVSVSVTVLGRFLMADAEERRERIEE